MCWKCVRSVQGCAAGMATKLREPALIPYSQVAVPVTQSETPFSRTLFAFLHAFLTLFPHTQHLLTLFSLGVGFSVCLPVQSSKRSANSEQERTLTGELYLVLCLAAGTNNTSHPWYHPRLWLRCVLPPGADLSSMDAARDVCLCYCGFSWRDDQNNVCLHAWVSCYTPSHTPRHGRGGRGQLQRRAQLR